ncbi:SRPBCC domain-containing protein [Rhodobacteraceae bacterium]|nr:SRPBCC domain-containing protein [Paracoccaceae bacterium]
MTTATELSLQTSRVINAPRDRLFDAWLDPKMLATFMTPMPGMPASDVTADARVGGRFLIVMHAGDQDLPHEGTYTTIDRPNRLVFTWESPMSPNDDSTVTIDFEEVSGGTKVTLNHVRFPNEESRDNHKGGWAHILQCLENTA